MSIMKQTLFGVYNGWDGYNQSLISAVSSINQDNLRFRLDTNQRSAGEIAAHIAFGRIDWFHRMGASGATELVSEAEPFWKPWGQIEQTVCDDSEAIVKWLKASWNMIEINLHKWTVDDLHRTYF